MNVTQLAEYHRRRADGIGALQALRIAHFLSGPLRFEWSGNSATFERDGYTVHVRREDDDDADLSFLGKFSDKWERGAISHDRHDSRSYRWFLPTSTEADHYKSLRDMGYGRRDAREMSRRYVIQDYKRMVEHGQSWIMTGVRVTASRAGVTLGNASLWGIESDSDAASVDEIVDDLTSEALREARATLALLCASH